MANTNSNLKLGTKTEKQIKSLSMKCQAKFWIKMREILNDKNGKGKRLYDGKIKKKYNQGVLNRKSDAIFILVLIYFYFLNYF